MTWWLRLAVWATCRSPRACACVAGVFQRFKIQEASKIIGMRRSVRRPPGDARGKRASAIRVPRSGMGIGPLALLVALHDFVRFVEPPTGHGHASWRQTDSQSHTYLAAPARTSDASNFRLPTSDFRLWTPSHRTQGAVQAMLSALARCPGRAGRVVCASLTPGDHARESPCAPQWPVRGRYYGDTRYPIHMPIQLYSAVARYIKRPIT